MKISECWRTEQNNVFRVNVSFLYPSQKIPGFLTFPGGIETERSHEIG